MQSPPEPEHGQSNRMFAGRRARDGIWRVDLLWPGLALFLALAWTSAAIWWRPELIRGDAFIFRDASHALLAADDLMAGRILYKDVFYAYGPLAAYSYAVWAALFGNSPTTLFCFQQLLTLGVVGLAYANLRMVLRPGAAACFLVLGLFPFLLIPGSSMADFAGVDYVSWERIGLLILALTWKPLANRRPLDGCVQGCVLALLQGFKFGGGLVAGVALLAADLFLARDILAQKESRQRWLKTNLALLAAFLGIEVLWAGVAFKTLPRDIALDALWPSYMLRSYQWYVGPMERWPHWHNLGYFVTAQWPILSCLALALFGIAVALRKTRPQQVAPAEQRTQLGKTLFLGAFFLIGVCIYFRHTWHFTQYAWTLILAGALGFRFLQPVFRMAVLVAWLPTTVASGRAVFLSPGPVPVPKTFPTGDTLWLSEARRAQLEKLENVLQSMPKVDGRAQPVIFFPEGAGLHHLLGVPHASRFFWLMGGLVQPHQEDEFLKGVAQASHIVVFFRHPQVEPPSRDPNSWSPEALTPTFPPEFSVRISQLLGDPVRIDDSCWIFPVKRQ